MTSRWFASAPRTRNCVSEPREPDWLTAMPGNVRITSESCVKPLERVSSPVITVTDEPVLDASIGTRLGEMTSSSGRRVCAFAGAAKRGDKRAGREAGVYQ